MFVNSLFSRDQNKNVGQLKLEQFCNWNEILILEGKDLEGTNSNIIDVAQIILLEYMRYNDLLIFLSAALYKKEKYARYNLTPPLSL